MVSLCVATYQSSYGLGILIWIMPMALVILIGRSTASGWAGFFALSFTEELLMGLSPEPTLFYPL
jgi:hypothetical protein